MNVANKTRLELHFFVALRDLNIDSQVANGRYSTISFDEVEKELEKKQPIYLLVIIT